MITLDIDTQSYVSLRMKKKRYNFTLSNEAHEKLRKLAGIASMSAYLEKLIKDAK